MLFICIIMKYLFNIEDNSYYIIELYILLFEYSNRGNLEVSNQMGLFRGSLMLTILFRKYNKYKLFMQFK